MRSNLERALVLMELRKYDQAEAELMSDLSREPNSAFIHAVLASCRSNLNKHKDAISCAKRAIALAPDMAYAHYVLAFSLSRFDQDLIALPAIEEALRLDPNDPDYWGLKANIYLKTPFKGPLKRPWQDALDCANNGLQYNPRHEYCAYARARALNGLGRNKEAQATIREALRFHPEDALLHETQAWILLNGGSAQDAREHYREALRLDPSSNSAREGFVSALRAKHCVYRLLLRLMQPDGTPRFLSIAMMLLFLAALMGLGETRIAFLKALAMKMFLPIFCLILLSVFLMLMGNPLFNLILKLDQSDRLTLSPDESTEANLLAICLVTIVLTVVIPVCTGHIVWYFATGLFTLLILSVVSTFEIPSGRFRKFMYFYLGVNFILAIIGMLTLTNCDFLEQHFKRMRT